MTRNAIRFSFQTPERLTQSLVSFTSLVFALARPLALLMLTVSLDFANKMALSSCPSDRLTSLPESLGLMVFTTLYIESVPPSILVASQSQNQSHRNEGEISTPIKSAPAARGAHTIASNVFREPGSLSTVPERSQVVAMNTILRKIQTLVLFIGKDISGKISILQRLVYGIKSIYCSAVGLVYIGQYRFNLTWLRVWYAYFVEWEGGHCPS
jgi:hypothetical protein